MKRSSVFKWNPWSWLPLLILALGFAVIQIGQWNTPLFYVFNHLPFPWVWTNLTELGDGLIVGILLFPFFRKRPQILTAFLLGIALNTLLVQGLKSYFALPRPASVLEPGTLRILGPVLKARAFPSGHSATVFLTAGILVYFLNNTIVRMGIVLLAFLVALSRVAVGAHWPQDVLMGSLLGWAIGWLTAVIIDHRQWVSPAPARMGGAGGHLCACRCRGNFAVSRPVSLYMGYPLRIACPGLGLGHKTMGGHHSSTSKQQELLTDVSCLIPCRATHQIYPIPNAKFTSRNPFVFPDQRPSAESR